MNNLFGQCVYDIGFEIVGQINTIYIKTKVLDETRIKLKSCYYIKHTLITALVDLP